MSLKSKSFIAASVIMQTHTNMFTQTRLVKLTFTMTHTIRHTPTHYDTHTYTITHTKRHIYKHTLTRTYTHARIKLNVDITVSLFIVYIFVAINTFETIIFYIHTVKKETITLT